MKINTIIWTILLPLLLASCATSSPLLKEERYGKIYEEQPVAILIMPPINNTNNVAAKEYMYSTLYQPLCNLGYYVFSPYMTYDILQQESAYDAENFLEADLSKFNEYIGADAVLFTIINEWSKGTTTINTNIEYRVVSTKTNEILFSHIGNITLDNSSNSGSAFGFIADLIVNAVTPIVVSARNANAYVLNDIPRGKYSSKYMLDQKWEANGENITATIKN